MRIVLDLQGYQAINRQRGIGRYSLSLAQAIARRAGSHEIWLALNARLADSIRTVKEAFHGLVPDERVTVFHLPGPLREKDPGRAWRIRSAEMIREHFLRSLAPDVVHLSSPFEGFLDDAVTGIGPSTRGFVATATLYDLIPFDNRETYLTDIGHRDWYFRKLQSLKNADGVLAISEHSRQRAIDVLHLPEDRAVNISAAVDSRFRKLSLSREKELLVRARYGLRNRFVMYLGGGDPRKNMEGLCVAYARLPAEVRTDRQLVIVCALLDSDRKRLEALAAKHGLRDRELVLPGPVSDDELVALYNLCELFVFPSLDEGFGLPVLEAMSCGAPVIGSNASSIPEVIGRDDALFDPRDEGAIANALEHALTNETFLRDLRAHSLERAQAFSWDFCADRAFALFESLAEEAKAHQMRSVAVGRDRPLLAYVSPVPPAMSGVADYSAELLPELARHYDIEVIVGQQKVEHDWLTANFPVRTFDWFKANADRFDRVLYHFGNNELHMEMFPLLERQPGIVVLHDLYLSGILQWMEGTGYAPAAFSQALYRSHGYQALATMKAQGAEAAVWGYPCSKEVIERATGVIVHSEYVRTAAEEWYGAGTASDWRVIPHLRALPDRPDKERARRELGLSRDSFLVCSFGFVNILKLGHELIRAWDRSGLTSDPECHLVFVGENHPGEYGAALVKLIEASRGGARIKITGYASQELFRTYLAAADAAVQLRTRTRGETSGTVLDCLAHGVPVVVNAHGTMADYPDGVVVKLKERFEEHELAESLDRLRGDPALREQLSAAGRRYVAERHQPRGVGAQYRDAIEHFDQAGPDAAYRRLLTSLSRNAAAPPPTETDLRLAATSIAANAPGPRLRHLLLDVSELVRRDHKSGIQRVVRRIAQHLLLHPPAGYRTEPVYLDGRQLRYARELTLEVLEIDNPGLSDEVIDLKKGDVFLGLDLFWPWASVAEELLGTFRLQGVRSYFLLYDLLPVLRPEFFAVETFGQAHSWLTSVTAHADGIICDSQAVADELREWLARSPPMRSEPLHIGFFHLGADLERAAKSLPKGQSGLSQTIGARPTFLMVGTIEPRKGHAQALRAFELLWADGLDVNLAIVGRQGWRMDELVKRIRKHPEARKRLFWFDDASDDDLVEVYESSAALLAASEGEGFGLPLVEAARYGLPIIARDLPVFRELASEHAFFFAGREPRELADAVKEWLKLNGEGRAPASGPIPRLSWAESAQQLLDVALADSWYGSWESGAPVVTDGLSPRL